VMTYDLHGAWDTVTGLNAPLYRRQAEVGTPSETLNVDWAVRYWNTNGCPRNKLIIGMGTYGRCFTLTNAGSSGLGAPVRGPCTAGTYTREAGFLAYYEICDFIKRPGSRTTFDNEQRAPYTVVGDQWVGYDNSQSLTEKVNYLKAGNYGGWMTWVLDLDDFTGTHCDSGVYPLHKTLNFALGTLETAKSGKRT